MKIVYRIVTAVIAICIVPNMMYNTLIRLVFSAGENLVEENMSVMKLIDYFSKDGMLHGLLEKSSDTEITDALRNLLTPAIISGVLLVLAILVCLAIFVIAIIKPMQKTTLVLSGSGIILTIASIITFNKCVGTPLVDGSVSISDIIGGGIVSTIIQLFSGIELLQLGTAAIMTAIIFVAIAVWTGAYVLTDLGADNKNKQ